MQSVSFLSSSADDCEQSIIGQPGGAFFLGGIGVWPAFTSAVFSLPLNFGSAPLPISVAVLAVAESCYVPSGSFDVSVPTASVKSVSLTSGVLPVSSEERRVGQEVR